MTQYFDGLHYGDVDLLGRVFHPRAIYACATDGSLAQVECSVGPRQFTDLLNLVYLDGRWQIIAKVFHYDLADQQSDPIDS